MSSAHSIFRRLYLLLGVGLLLLNFSELQATHLMGGDLTYSCLGGNTYQFTLTLYRDCRGVPLQTANQRMVMFSNSCGIAETNVDLTFQSFQEITPICPSQQANSACNGGPIPGVEEYIFTATVTLPQQCDDWTFYYVRCCRNGAITNLQNPLPKRIYIEATLDNLNVVCNSSPVFTNKPVPFLCDGSPFLYNNGAIDPDGDSLVFELIPPRNKTANNPPVNIPFTGNYSTSYPLTTSPANTFNFDPFSGQMSFTPGGIQQAVITVLVKEYRNGVLIGTVLRDIQLVVLVCSNDAPTLDPPSNVQGAALNGNTFSVCAGNTLSFDLLATDPNPGDNLTFDSNILGVLPGATFTQTFGNPNTASVSWPTSIADTGTYFISFLLYDDGCPLIASQVVGFNIIVAAGEIYPPQDVYICPSTTTNLPLTTNIPNTGGNYQWSPAAGLNNPNIANPIATIGPSGTASYLVTYTGGVCPVFEQINVLPAGLVSLPDTVQVCEGDSIQLQASFQQFGPNNPFTYSWDPPIGLSNTTIEDPMASPSNTTTYTVTATTINCSFATDVVVEVIPLPDLLNIPDDSLCQNDTIMLFPSGTNLGGATFSWSPVVGMNDPGLLNPSVSPNSTQIYTLTATNQCGSDSESATVNVFDPFSVTLSAQNISCSGGNDGSVTAIVTGGNGNPSYLWTPGGNTGSSINNLVVGSYTVNLADAAGCFASASVSLTEPGPLMASLISQTDINCFGDGDGSLNFSASGGTAPYQYALNGGSYQSNPNFGNLGPGTYSLMVRDANLCETPLGPFTITQPAAPVSISLVSSISAGCNGIPGQIVVGASGGVAPYSFSINNGVFQPFSTFSNLTPGIYLMRVRDANNCKANISVSIYSVTDPVASLDSLGSVSCFGGSDGLIRVSLGGGQSPYLLSIDGGTLGTDTLFTGLTAGSHQVYLEDSSVPSCNFTLNVDIPEPNPLEGIVLDEQDIDCFGGLDGQVKLSASGGTKPYQYALGNNTFSSDSLFTTLGAGIYTLFVQDANGCEDTLSSSLSQPDALLLQGQAFPATCFGDANGRVILSATGGILPYRFSFDGGAFVVNNQFGGLKAGTYTVQVMDELGCVDSLSLTVTEPPVLDVQFANILEIACFGDSTGQLSVVGNGGTAPYQYRMAPAGFSANASFTGLPIGSYQIQIRDANGCVAGIETTLIQPDRINGTISTEDISCFGANDGQAEMEVQGGVSPYLYAWSDNGPATAARSGLGPGAFWAEATDDKGCIITFLGEIVEPDSMGFDSTDVVDVLCFGENTGEVLVSVGGGIPPYTYNWSNGATDSAQVGVPADTYFISVTDDNACEILDTLIVNQPPELLVGEFDLNDAFCDWNNGEIRISVLGGNPPYFYEWADFPGLNDSVISGLDGGDSVPPYLVRIVDSLGCEISESFSLGRDPSPTAAFETDPLTTDTLLLSDDPVQFINLSQNALTYYWEFGDGALSELENPIHLYQETGNYSIQLVAYDERFLCPDTASLDIIIIPPGDIFFPNGFTPNRDGKNDYFFLVGEGILELELTIFDRWGHILRHLEGVEPKWDGTDRWGEEVQEGVYVYVAQIRLNSGTVIKRVGTVTLFR